MQSGCTSQRQPTIQLQNWTSAEKNMQVHSTGWAWGLSHLQPTGRLMLTTYDESAKIRRPKPLYGKKIACGQANDAHAAAAVADNYVDGRFCRVASIPFRYSRCSGRHDNHFRTATDAYITSAAAQLALSTTSPTVMVLRKPHRRPPQLRMIVSSHWPDLRRITCLFTACLFWLTWRLWLLFV